VRDHGLPGGTVWKLAELEGGGTGNGGTKPTGAKIETPFPFVPG